MPEEDQTPSQALFESVLSSLRSSSNYEAIADELESLQAIFSDSKFSLYTPPPPAHLPHRTTRAASPPWSLGSTISAPLRILLETPIQTQLGQIEILLLLSIPTETYPTTPPLLQLQNIYLGPFEVDQVLFSTILRSFMHEPIELERESMRAAGNNRGVPFIPGEVCLFEGIEFCKNLCEDFILLQEKNRSEMEMIRQSENGGGKNGGGRMAVGMEKLMISTEIEERSDFIPIPRQICPKIVSGEPIIDRKSVFIAHYARVESLQDVQVVISTLLENKKIQNASHNISAFTFVDSKQVVHSDCDDDGETAAGSRLAHLLSLLGVSNTLVVVSRWYGGIHLGADRFKLINSAAREVLELAGQVEVKSKKK